MPFEVHGELIPVGGGDTISLEREVLTVGRRESCDICMRFPNISGLHCELRFRDGYWYVRDLDSTNGVKVNGTQVREKLLHPQDEVAIGKRKYVIAYRMPEGQRPVEEVDADNIMSQSLMERAGLERPRRDAARPAPKKPKFDAADFLLNDNE